MGMSSSMRQRLQVPLPWPAQGQPCWLTSPAQLLPSQLIMTQHGAVRRAGPQPTEARPAPSPARISGASQRGLVAAVLAAAAPCCSSIMRDRLKSETWAGGRVGGGGGGGGATANY